MVQLAEVAEDGWAAPVTAVFAFIGVLWLSLRIFSFWRLVASLFVLPGTSVCDSLEFLLPVVEFTLTRRSSASLARKALGHL